MSSHSSLFANHLNQAPAQVQSTQPVSVTPAPATNLTSLTEEQIKEALPNNLRSSVTPALVNMINSACTDPIMAEQIRDNFLTYTNVLKEGKFKTEEYLNAVAYVSYKLMGYNNEEAYSRTHVKRYADLLAKGTSKKDISAYVAAYHKGKLVNLIMEQSLVPTWVLNQDLYQKALNVNAELMTSANSELVRQKAADSILTHLSKPEGKNFQINIGEVENSGMKEMREMLTQLAQNQKQAIDSGAMKTIDIAASRLPVKEEK